MASAGNQHCVNCIGTLSLPILFQHQQSTHLREWPGGLMVCASQVRSQAVPLLGNDRGKSLTVFFANAAREHGPSSKQNTREDGHCVIHRPLTRVVCTGPYGQNYDAVTILPVRLSVNRWRTVVSATWKYDDPRLNMSHEGAARVRHVQPRVVIFHVARTTVCHIMFCRLTNYKNHELYVS